MKATFENPNRNNGRNYDKELIYAATVVGCAAGEMKELVTVRCWMGRSRSSSVVYASIWTFQPWTSGSGKAGGYGYCKKSAAVGDAIQSAGIRLDQDINGRGESSIREALKAIADEMCYSNILIVEH